MSGDWDDWESKPQTEADTSWVDLAENGDFDAEDFKAPQQSTQIDVDNFGDFGGAELNSGKKVSLNLKSAGMLIAVSFVLLAIVLFAINSINAKPASKPQQQQGQQQTQPQAQTKPAKSDVSLIPVPSTTQVDYSGKIYEATGTVTSKSKYLCGNQVVYLIKVEIQMGGSAMNISYFCGYNVYNGVSNGDVVTVKYQQVSDACFSVNTISK